MVADHKVCIIVLGELSVGKTSLMERFCKNTFKESQIPTLIVDSYNKTIILKEKQINLELWDTAGQERFKAIIKEYFRKADGVLLAYDMTNITSFMKLSNWLRELRELNEKAIVLIVGNKSDLLHQNPKKQVSRTTVETYAREEGLDFCETSAKNNENVDEVFKNLTLKVLEKKKVPPFFNEISDIEIIAGRLTDGVSDNGQQQTANGLPPIRRLEDDSLPPIRHLEEESLPPIKHLEEDFGNEGNVIQLTMEKPREKQKKSCC